MNPRAHHLFLIPQALLAMTIVLPVCLADGPASLELAPHVEPLSNIPQGPFVRLGDGGILGIRDSQAVITHDDGTSWECFPIFKPDQGFSIRPELTMLRTRRGVIVLIFSNNAVLKYSWDKKTNLPKSDMHLPSYSIRSLDDGRTWTDLTLLHEGWCGCNQDMIETRTGTIIVSGQELDYDKGRHVTRPYVSSDEGKTWRKMRTLDIGGRGDHAGAIEGTLEQLGDGRIWLLLRSYHGFFYESSSADQGRTWSDPKPSRIRSVGAPGKLKRLASGRLVLLWNAIPNAGFVRREEISLSLSDDDGATWSPPQVIARNKGGRVAYSHVFEHQPGVLWITTMQGDLRVQLREEDFVRSWSRVVAFGDSTTAPRGTLRVYADLLQRDLSGKANVNVAVTNAGVGSNSTEDARKRMQKDVLSLDPSWVIVQFGINDAAVDVWKTPPAQEPRVSLARFKENVEWIVDTLQKDEVSVVLMTPNPMRWTPKLLGLYGKPPYEPDRTDGFNVLLKDYAEAVRLVAREKEVLLVDVYGLFIAYDRMPDHSTDELLLDGMHPNQDGHRLIADHLVKSAFIRIER